ncbi:CII family transcriptional regulator [Limnobacter sp.]|uniref:CII family transcriptional regulator n=1 Tax=Limnobacter sp. TaxID=2003368 RepID=UPI0027364394|nr:CII family transcriptional regulator [Limnobacter sp.]MDP3273422.1 hypothetical protein [Limnobacter sp.]
MSPVSAELKDRSRKNQAVILQAIGRTGQQVAADCIGTSVSTVSRWQSSEETKMGLENIALLLAAIGLKVVPKDMKCFPAHEVQALFTLAKAHLARAENIESMLNFEE